jgi:hypothetical protein
MRLKSFVSLFQYPLRGYVRRRILCVGFVKVVIKNRVARLSVFRDKDGSSLFRYADDFGKVFAGIGIGYKFVSPAIHVKTSCVYIVERTSIKAAALSSFHARFGWLRLFLSRQSICLCKVFCLDFGNLSQAEKRLQRLEKGPIIRAPLERIPILMPGLGKV